MLGSILNTILLPFYLAVIILLIVMSLVTRLIGEVARFLELVCELTGDVMRIMVEAISAL